MANKDIEYAIRDALFHDPSIRSPRLHVSMIEDLVVLEGEVDTLRVKTRAEDVARALAPGYRIDNSLTVAGNRPPSDSDLTSMARELLAKDPEIPNTLGVKVEDGYAILIGGVPNQAVIQRAEQVIGDIAGIKGTHLQVTYLDRILVADTPYDLDDQSVVDDIASTLAKLEPPLDHRVTVRVNNGIAYLSGEVLTGTDRLKAERVAYLSPGVHMVHNNLVAYDGATGGNEEAQSRIRERIGRPYDDATTGYIGVMVVGETAYLYGYAEKPEGREQAERMARKEPGIRYVVNDIKMIDRQKA